jgi:hypothetical protein
MKIAYQSRHHRTTVAGSLGVGEVENGKFTTAMTTTSTTVITENQSIHRPTLNNAKHIAPTAPFACLPSRTIPVKMIATKKLHYVLWSWILHISSVHGFPNNLVGSKIGCMTGKLAMIGYPFLSLSSSE